MAYSFLEEEEEEEDTPRHHLYKLIHDKKSLQKAKHFSLFLIRNLEGLYQISKVEF
jgi:hypothetical protein